MVIVESRKAQNLVMLKKLIVVSIGMFCFGFALVPICEKICDVTGINSVVKADEFVNTQIDSSRVITVQFDANYRGGSGWSLKPTEREATVHPGQLISTSYKIQNQSGQAFYGQAIPSYGPQYASKYVKKLDCFCFEQQSIAPGETRILPIVFVVEPDLPIDVHTITLSFTMFSVESGPISQSEIPPGYTVC